MDVQGRTAIVTGASMGIGAATARALARGGANVVVAARSAEPLEALARELGIDRVLAIPTDVTQPDEVRALVARTDERFGAVDILVNNAGVGLAGRVETMSVPDFEGIIATNVLGPLHAMQEVIPHMRASGGGLIINVSSMVTKLTIPTIGGYRATKMALDALSDNARIELARDNIRVVSVHPGATSSNFFRNTVNGTDPGGRPPGPGTPDTPEHVAQRILWAVGKEPREVYMDRRSRVLATITTVFPSLFERIVTRFGPR